MVSALTTTTAANSASKNLLSALASNASTVKTTLFAKIATSTLPLSMTNTSISIVNTNSQFKLKPKINYPNMSNGI